MMNRTPSFTGRRTFSFRVNALAFDVQNYVQQEAVVEGVLHVSSAQAHSCLKRFDDIKQLGAPELPPLSSVLTTPPPYASSASSKAGQHVLDTSTPTLVASSSLGERVLQEAFCLASPAENPVDDDGILRWPRFISSATTTATNSNANRTSAANNSYSTHRLASPAEPPMREQSREQSNNSNTTEAIERLEIAASKRESCSGLTREVLRSSETRARSRRRKLLHLFRNTLAARDSIVAALHSTDAAQQLADFGSSLASLMSWDEMVMTSADGREVRLWDDESFKTASFD